jgi:hypothetical protein
MTVSNTPSSSVSKYTLSTADFAARNNVEPETVIKRRCKFGSFYGVTAVQQANGRLLWPDEVPLKGHL